MTAKDSKLYVTEIVAGILSNLPQEKSQLSTELRKIHPILLNLKDSCPNTLGDIVFDLRGTFAYSEEIEQAFSNLETAMILPRRNPELNHYEITDKLRDYFKKYVENKLNAEQSAEIKKIASKMETIASAN